MDHLKKVEWEVLIVDEGRTQRVQKSCQKFYRIFSQIRSVFRLLLLSEPLKVWALLYVFLHEFAERTKELDFVWLLFSRNSFLLHASLWWMLRAFILCWFACRVTWRNLFNLSTSLSLVKVCFLMETNQFKWLNFEDDLLVEFLSISRRTGLQSIGFQWRWPLPISTSITIFLSITTRLFLEITEITRFKKWSPNFVRYIVTLINSLWCDFLQFSFCPLRSILCLKV